MFDNLLDGIAVLHLDSESGVTFQNACVHRKRILQP